MTKDEYVAVADVLYEALLTEKRRGHVTVGYIANKLADAIETFDAPEFVKDRFLATALGVSWRVL